MVFAKVKGVQKDNLTVDLEQFITVKGIKALGNQLTTDKVKQINLLDPLPFEEAPEPEPQPETTADGSEAIDLPEPQVDDEGQTILF